MSSRARYFVEATSIDDLKFAIDLASSQAIDLVPIGQGSNIVFVDDLDAVVILINLLGRSKTGEVATAAAGEPWHDFVEWTLHNQLYGLENLALIPGTVGAAPIQNIGAYGVELDEFVENVSVIDTETLEESSIPASDCGFAYRQSRFQKEKKLLVTGLSLRLKQTPDPQLCYPGLKDRLAMDKLSETPINVFEAVCRIRAEKLPDPARLPNVGSFFKNPVVTATQAENLQLRFHGLPLYPTDSDTDRVKLSAAWLIDQAGLKLTRVGGFEVSEQHALVIVNLGGGQKADLLALIERVQTQVHHRFGVDLEPEPGFLPIN